MSRIGKYPVPVPAGVQVTIADQILTAKGKLGTLTLPIAEEISATLEDGKVVVKPVNDSKRAFTLWGTTRALINNLVTGVSNGFSVNLEINGVGYRAAVNGKVLNLQLGYSHDIDFPIPDDVKISCEKPTSITVTGADKQRVGAVAAKIRSFRKPEPYKGKGVKYATETIRRKEGKKK
ncbi:50S ribosomal protein L6 [Aliidongia dinghuensis]|uniref:Large ribosomal subunit protein uL6 n=1 Tax=Aliidongia dinghuensis TaxID=1867774 RepID=A0A8J2YW60_9PROT|nr:50S ribosomal protein L6 [Aliidongia dinghuensis]GGF29626.1 50S ribosomal protein L6 [Aliidongia dinghuensis]